MSLIPYAMVDMALIPKYAGIMGEWWDFVTVCMVSKSFALTREWILTDFVACVRPCAR